MPRSRMTPRERRDQLLDVGAEMFASATSFDAVSMDDVADRAGVSRALVYHYFPNKKELFGAVWRRAHDRLLESATFAESAPLIEQIRRALVVHFEFYESNAPLVFLANRGELSLDPVVREPINEDLDVLRDRLLAATGLSGQARIVASAGLTGWIAFVREVVILRVQGAELSRSDAIALCLAVVTSALGPSWDPVAPPSRA